jgi:hypothetical protein
VFEFEGHGRGGSCFRGPLACRDDWFLSCCYRRQAEGRVFSIEAAALQTRGHVVTFSFVCSQRISFFTSVARNIFIVLL